MSATDVEEALRLGGWWEEAKELLRSEIWEDEWQREMLRQQFVQNRLLMQIAANTGQIPELTPGDVIDDPREPIEDRDGPQYWVTEETIEVTNENNFNSESWDFFASTVVLLFSDDTTFSFLPPGDNLNREFTLDADDYSPFSVTAADGVYAEKVWYRQADSATTTPELDILAFR